MGAGEREDLFSCIRFPALLMWGGAVVYDNKNDCFLDSKKGNFRLVAAGPVGEGIAIPDKVLCQKGFDTGCTGGGFFS